MTDTELADLEHGLAALMAAVLRLEERVIRLTKIVQNAARETE